MFPVFVAQWILCVLLCFAYHFCFACMCFWEDFSFPQSTKLRQTKRVKKKRIVFTVGEELGLDSLDTTTDSPAAAQSKLASIHNGSLNINKGILTLFVVFVFVTVTEGGSLFVLVLHVAKGQVQKRILLQTD